MTTSATRQIKDAWQTLQSLVPVAPIRDEDHYDQAVEKLNELLDVVGDNESHPLYDLLDTLGILIHAYEEASFPTPSATGVDVLKYLMEEHHVPASNLPEVGNEEVVAQVPAGKRELNLENIRALSKRFGVSPATFVD